MAKNIDAFGIPISTGSVFADQLNNLDTAKSNSIAENNKFINLIMAKQDKVSSLYNEQNKLALTDTYSMGPNGFLESNKNKIYNSFTADQKQQYLSDVVSNSIHDDHDGKGQYQIINGVRTPFKGETERLYMYGTKDDPNAIKLGLASDVLPNSDYRYQPGKAQREGMNLGSKEYGWEAGPKGIDLNKKYLDILLPKKLATAFEATMHGNKDALANRVVKNAQDPKMQQAYGSGKSEYYNSLEGLLGKSTGGNTAYDNPEVLVPQAKQYAEKPASDIHTYKMNESLGKRAYNTGAGFVASIGKGLVDTADLIGDATGLYDLGTEEQKTNAVNKFVGYDDYYTKEAAKEAKIYATNIFNAAKDKNKDIDYKDVYNLIRVGVTTPELLGESLGQVAELFVGTGKFTKVAKAVRAVETEMKAGKITQLAAKAQIDEIKNVQEGLSSIQKIGQAFKDPIGFTGKNAGLLTIAGAEVNNQIDDFKANNNGNGPSVAQVARMYGTEVLQLGLDRFVDLNILKGSNALNGISNIKSLKDTLSKVKNYLPDETSSAGKKLLGWTTTNAAKIVHSMGEEAGQEFIQTMAETLNKQWGTNTYDENGKVTGTRDFMDVITNDDNVVEALTGAGLGMGGAVQFKAVGAANSVFGPKSLKDKLDTTLNDIGNSVANSPDAGMHTEMLKAQLDEKNKSTAELRTKQDYLNTKTKDNNLNVFDYVKEIQTIDNNYPPEIVQTVTNEIDSLLKMEKLIPTDTDVDPEVKAAAIKNISPEGYSNLQKVVDFAFKSVISNNDTQKENINKVLNTVSAKAKETSGANSEQVFTFDDIIKNSTDAANPDPIANLDAYKTNLANALPVTANKSLKEKITAATTIDNLIDIKDEINDELFSAADVNTLVNFAKSTEPFSEKSIPRRLAETVINTIAPSSMGVGVGKVKNEFSNKLSTVSTSVLKKLLNNDSINTLSQSFTTTTGANPITSSYITSAINKELDRRNLGELFVSPQETRIKQKTFSDANSIAFGDINRDVSILAAESPTISEKDFSDRLTGIYNKLEGAIKTLSPKELSKLSPNSIAGLIGLDSLNINAKKSAFDALKAEDINEAKRYLSEEDQTSLDKAIENKSINDRDLLLDKAYAEYENQIELNPTTPLYKNYASSPDYVSLVKRVIAETMKHKRILDGDIQTKKSYLARTLQADYALTFADINVAEQIADELQANEDTKLDTATYNGIKKKLSKLRLDSKTNIQLENDKIAKEIETRRDILKNVSGLSSTVIKNIESYTPEQITEMYNYFIVDDTLMAQLEAVGLDLEADKQHIKINEQTVEIC